MEKYEKETFGELEVERKWNKRPRSEARSPKLWRNCGEIYYVVLENIFLAAIHVGVAGKS